MLLTTQLVIQYNPKWITKIEKGRKFSGKNRKFSAAKSGKKRKTFCFSLCLLFKKWLK